MVTDVCAKVEVFCHEDLTVLGARQVFRREKLIAQDR